MALAFFTLSASAVLLLYFWLQKVYTFWKRNGVPTARGFVPILGHILPVFAMQTNFTGLITKIYNDYEGYSMIGIYKATKPVLVIREPSLVKVLLQSNFSAFHENGIRIQPEVDTLLARNPFFSDGQIWMIARKRLSCAFSNVKLKMLFSAVTGVCKKLEDFLDKRLVANNKCEIELKYLFSKFTGEVVANAGLGIEGFCFEDKTHPYAFDQVGNMIFKQSIFGGFSTFITLFLPHINSMLKFRFVPKKVDAYFRQIVTEILQLRRKESTPKNDIFQIMFDLEKTKQNSDDDGIASNMFSVFMDGYETTNIALSFIGYHLAVHQDVQEKLRREVKGTILRHGGVLKYEALKEMTYMDQVINETLRCYPPLGVMSKLCTDEFELRGSDGISYRLRPGDEIVVPLFALQHDPKYWDDSEAFVPGRFDEDGKQSIEKMTFLPFGEGSRMCVGMRLAMMQMKSCLATVLRKYKFEFSSKTRLPLKMSPRNFLSEPIGGFWVHVSEY